MVMKYRMITTMTLAMLLASPIQAAPEDRGMRGVYLALSTGLALGHATDKDGDTAGGHYGVDTTIRFGEEVVDRLTMGLTIASANDLFNRNP